MIAAVAKWVIAIVDDDIQDARLLQRWIESPEHEVALFHSGEALLEALGEVVFDAVLLDLQMPGIGGLETLARMRAFNPSIPVLMLTADEAIESVVDCMRAGAYSYLTKPMHRALLVETLTKALEHYRLSLRLSRLERESGELPSMIGGSPAMLRLFDQIDRVAATEITVVIYGNTGTGKELVAESLHNASPRRDGPFIAVNCAAIAQSMQEGALFGHEKGAFTGAVQRKRGLFEQADGGTLFLDELTELSLELQAKLLRALQERKFYRLGGESEVSVNVRVIAATNRALAREVAAGRFREDLYYRLAVFEIEVPELSARTGDLPRLAEHFLAIYGTAMQRAHLRLAPAALDALERHAWPGNVRELQNVIQRAVVRCAGDQIGVEDLGLERSKGPPPTTHEGDEPPISVTQDNDEASEDELPIMTLSELERLAIVQSMRRHGGKAGRVSEELGIPKSTLYRRVKKLGLS